jgi:hypothetical protein
VLHVEAEAVAGSSRAMMVMACFMLASIAWKNVVTKVPSR